MRKSLLLLCSVVTLLSISSCQGGSNGGHSTADSVAVAETTTSSYDVVNEFFTSFQQANDGWTKTEEGHDKLKKAFEEKMTTDVEFAKAIASYETESQYGNRIRKDDSISSYNKEDGEEGEIKALTKELLGKVNSKDVRYTHTNKYTLFAYPKVYGNITSIIDQNNFENIDSFNRSEVTLLTANGDSIVYNVYTATSKNSLSNFKYTFKI